ncbi:MAG: CPBP family intramembrane metalloprotease [Sphingobacteriales bacterium]|nr:MAG: CPBP family intramembrane metalloprotease [Sphingobacteriales bacterium]
MNIIARTLQQHISIVRNNLLAVVMALATVAVVVYYGIAEQKIPHALGYLGAVWLCAFITDVVVNLLPIETIGFPIKKPVGKEVLLITICTLLGIAFLLIRFFSGWETLKPIIRMAVMPLILFTFPIVLGAVYLFVYKYKFKELGVNLNYWYLPLILHPIWGAITMAVAPHKSHWVDAYEKYGILEMLVMGLLTAALAEEFLRMLLQTRLAKFINSGSIALVIASVVWALMHMPINMRDNPGAGVGDVAIGTLVIVPLGLFWGYLNYRTKSLIPALLMHGFNLWGLQNL